MNGQRNTVSVGGNVGGHVVAGDDNVVSGAAAPEQAARGGTKDAMGPRLGFVVDIVGFGRRDAGEKRDLQDRLDTLVNRVVDGLGVDPADTRTSDAGDARLVFLPVGLDTSRLAPAVVDGMIEHLGRDNRRYRDRMRLRMSMGTGLVGDGPLGFTGELVVDLHRLVDSVALRRAITDHVDIDLAILVNRALHDDVIRPGHLAPGDFARVDVATKEYAGPAWLRLC